MGFIPVEGQHCHNVASKIRMYLREFSGDDLKKAQSILRKVIMEFDEPSKPIRYFDEEAGIITTEYPDGWYEVRIDLTKQEEE